MFKTIPLLTALFALSHYTTALPSSLPTTELTPRAPTPPNPDCIPGYSDRTTYEDFEALPNGTFISRRAALRWSGFQTTTEQFGIIPSDCYYFGPDRETKCHYAYAAHARDSDASMLPTLRARAPATLMKLRWLSWAAGPTDYFGPFETMRVLGYERGPRGGLRYSGRFVEFDWTSQTAGATGAPMYNITLPTDFVFAAYRFNITTAGDAEPVLLFDDMSIVTYTPV